MAQISLRTAAVSCVAALAFLAAANAHAQAPLQPCHLPGLKDAVLCGSLKRPLSPNEPAGTQIDIHYAVVPAKARDKLADPLYFLAGGPGQSALDVIPTVQAGLDRINNRRDLVFVDQRGTGKSAPLKCETDIRGTLAENLSPARNLARMEACRTELQRLPYGDLRQFSTTLAMTDLDAVRAALGHARINLAGASYGTRAALEYLRLYPSRVRRLVLDGVAPADMSLPDSFAVDSQAALTRLLADCAADSDCARRHPDLGRNWDTLFANLPKTVAVTHPLTGKTESLTLTEAMIAGLVRMPLYLPALTAALPAAIDQAAAGQWTPLFGLASAIQGRPGTEPAMGMHYSVICAEDGSPAQAPTPASTGQFGHSFRDAYAAVCAGWPKAVVGADYYKIPASAVPVLLLSGGIDPATPPRHAERVAKALGSKARHIVVAKAGHGILGVACASGIVFRFIDAADEDEALKVDGACLDRIPRPTAFVPLSARIGEAK